MQPDDPIAKESRQQIRHEHREIGRLAKAIVAADHPDQLGVLLSRLQAVLEQHFRREEQELDGLHASIRARTPQFDVLLLGLRKDHRDLLAEADMVQAVLRNGGGRQPLLAMARGLIARLREHEVRETELYVDSIWTDLGEGD